MFQILLIYWYKDLNKQLLTRYFYLKYRLLLHVKLNHSCSKFMEAHTLLIIMKPLKKTWNQVLMWQYMLMYFEGVFGP